MSDATQQMLITAVCGVVTALIAALAARNAGKAKDASREATDASKANSTAIADVQQSADKAAVKAAAASVTTQVVATKVEEVHKIVNGKNDALLAKLEEMQRKTAELEAENRKLRGN